MKRANMIGTLIAAAIILSIAGCQMFENSPTGISVLDATAAVTSNFIMGESELTTWGAYYVKDDTFLRVDLPVSGAIKVEYSVARGWKGAVFVRTGAPVGLEIGLSAIDGETDVVENVCVSYVEGGSFTSTPDNVEERVQDTDGNRIHYTQVMDDGSTRDWWPATADFEFSSDTTTTCAVEDGDVQWEVIPGGAYAKPTAAAAPATEVYPPCPGTVLASCVGEGCIGSADIDVATRVVSSYTGMYTARDAVTNGLNLFIQRSAKRSLTVQEYFYDGTEWHGASGTMKWHAGARNDIHRSVKYDSGSQGYCLVLR